MTRCEASNGTVPGPESSTAEILAYALMCKERGDADWMEAAVDIDPTRRQGICDALSRLADLPEILSASAGDRHWIGRELGGRYELRGWVGAGAMGVVFDAWDQQLDRRVALKMMHQGLLDPVRGAARFHIEAEAMAAVRHTNVARIHDRGETPDGELYLAMEFVEGTGLDVIIESAGVASGDDASVILQGALDGPPAEPSYVRSAVRWTRDIARGLAAAHAQGIVHRDVKPSNILIGRDNVPVLVDFGIAAREGMETITRGNTGVGTPAYMAPEVVAGGKNRERSADIYGLAATLYHLVARQPPYPGTAPAVLAAIASREPKPARHVRPGIPRDLQAVLDRGMHRNLARRYSSVESFEEDLSALLDFRPVSARSITAAERVGRRLLRSKIARGAALALLAVGLLLGYWAHQGRTAERVRVLYAQLPPAFTIGRASLRKCTSAEESQHLRSTLNELVAEASSAIPARVLRAAFRRDNGEWAGAADDMGAVARELGSAFSAALAEEYARALPAEGRILLDGLPKPQSPEDEYLLIHELARSGQFGPAMKLLEGPAPEAVVHAEEIRLLGSIVAAEQPEAAAREGLQALLRLEERLGGPSATTENLRGRFLTVLGRFTEARVHLKVAIGLAPHSHKLRNDAGWASYRDGDVEDAMRHLERAMTARPTDPKAFGHAVRVLSEAGQIKRAEEVLARAPTARGSEWYILYSAIKDTWYALELYLGGDTLSAKQRASETLTRLGEPSRPGDDDLMRQILAAIASPEGSVFAATCHFIAKHPYQWRRRELLLQLLPADLSSDESEALRGLLVDLESFMSSRPNTFPREGVGTSTPTKSDHK